MIRTDYYFTVFWDNSNGTDWDESFSSPLTALARYKSCHGSYKSLVMTDKVNGDRTLLDSKGTNNIDRYHVRHLFNLAGCMEGIE